MDPVFDVKDKFPFELELRKNCSLVTVIRTGWYPELVFISAVFSNGTN